MGSLGSLNSKFYNVHFCHDDFISDLTADQLRLEFSILRTCGCEYNNLVSLHPIFTKLDIVDG